MSKSVMDPSVFVNSSNDLDGQIHKFFSRETAEQVSNTDIFNMLELVAAQNVKILDELKKQNRSLDEKARASTIGTRSLK